MGKDILKRDEHGRVIMPGEDLRRADLTCANLEDANLQGARLEYAILLETKLQGADLRGANLDYSAWPLWCGSQGVIVDRRIAAQIAAHFCALVCDDPEVIASQEALLPLARTSHRAADLGLLEKEESCVP